MHTRPIRLESITDVQALLKRLAELNIIRLVQSKSHTLIEVQDDFTKQFIVDQNGNTYLLADLVLGLDNDDTKKIFPAADGELVSVDDITDRLSEDDIPNVLYNVPLANMLRTIWINDKDIMLRAPRSAHFNLFLPLLFPTIEFQRNGEIVSEETYGVYKHLNHLLRPNIALRDLIWLNFKENQKRQPALEYRLSMAKSEAHKKKINTRLNLIKSAFADYQFNLRLQKPYFTDNLCFLIKLEQACIEDLKNKTRQELIAYQQTVMGRRAYLSVVKGRKNSTLRLLLMEKSSKQNRLKLKDQDTAKYAFAIMIAAWAIGLASGLIPTSADALSPLELLTTVLALNISFAAAVFFSVRAMLRAPLEAELKKVEQRIQKKRAMILGIEAEIKNYEKQLEVIPQILLNLTDKDETLSKHVENVYQFLLLVEATAEEFSALANKNRKVGNVQNILTISQAEQSDVNDSSAGVVKIAENSQIADSSNATTHSSQASEYANYAQLPSQLKAQYSRLFQRINTNIGDHLVATMPKSAAMGNRN